MRGIIPIVLTSAAAIALASAAFSEERSYAFDDFQRIDAAMGVEVKVTTGTGYAVEAEALRGNLDRLVIRQKGDRLVIKRKKPLGLIGALRSDLFVVTVSLPQLTVAEASSGAAISVDGDGTADLVVDASSGSNVKIRGISEGSVDIDASSGAHVLLAGHCGSITADASSGATVQAGDLICRMGQFDASSGASVRGHVTGAVSADVSSGASVKVQGGADIAKKSLSSGGSLQVI